MNSQTSYQSFFDGGLLSLIFNRLTNLLIIVLTLGFGLPWALCRSYRWRIRHTVIEGYRLDFDGKAHQLFGNWVKWWLLILITFGIYGFWVQIKLTQWITKHTYMR